MAVFYPDDLPRKRWFEHYAARFDTVEINNTFYRLPEPRVFETWRAAAPPGFCYAVKFNRFGTHFKKLMDAPATIGRFLEAAERLEATLGPILVHLPPQLEGRSRPAGSVPLRGAGAAPLGGRVPRSVVAQRRRVRDARRTRRRPVRP